jgi:hypothetical protein
MGYVDIDALLRRVYGHKKEGTRFGHAKVGGYDVLLRGLSPLVATPPKEPPAQTWRIWAGTRRAPTCPGGRGGELLAPVTPAGREATVKVRGVAVAMLRGQSWAPDPVSDQRMNVGTARGPLPAHSRLCGRKAHRLLTAAGWGGAAVVVAGVTTRRGARVSRAQGEGRAPACSGVVVVRLMCERRRWAGGARVCLQ